MNFLKRTIVERLIYLSDNAKKRLSTSIIFLENPVNGIVKIANFPFYTNGNKLKYLQWSELKARDILAIIKELEENNFFKVEEVNFRKCRRKLKEFPRKKTLK